MSTSVLSINYTTCKQRNVQPSLAVVHKAYADYIDRLPCAAYESFNRYAVVMMRRITGKQITIDDLFNNLSTSPALSLLYLACLHTYF